MESASKAMSFLVFLPFKPEALDVSTKLALRCGKTHSPQLISLAEVESTGSGDYQGYS